MIPAHAYRQSQPVATPEASAGWLYLPCHSPGCQGKGSLAFYCGFQSECLIVKNILPKQSLNCTRKKNSPKSSINPHIYFCPIPPSQALRGESRNRISERHVYFYSRMLAGTCPHTLGSHWDLRVVMGALLLRWAGSYLYPDASLCLCFYSPWLLFQVHLS